MTPEIQQSYDLGIAGVILRHVLHLPPGSGGGQSGLNHNIIPVVYYRDNIIIRAKKQGIPAIIPQIGEKDRLRKNRAGRIGILYSLTMFRITHKKV